MEREARVAAAGFAPQPRAEDEGFTSCPCIPGRPMKAGDLSPGVLARLASYCAFRGQSLPAAGAEIGLLQEMAEHNLQELKFDLPLQLCLERPAYVDGKMQPHEWLLTPAGQIVKTDSGSHGDDHFFPGATDIAWDLAGAIVEWKMDSSQAKSFLEMYHRAAGDDARSRIADFILAYTVFRCAYCTMAAHAMRGSEEAGRMEQTAGDYTARLFRHAQYEGKTPAFACPT